MIEKIKALFTLLAFGIRNDTKTLNIVVGVSSNIIEMTRLAHQTSQPITADMGLQRVTEEGDEIMGQKVSVWIAPGEHNPIKRSTELRAKLDISYMKEKLIMDAIENYDTRPSLETLNALLQYRKNYVEQKPNAI